MTIVLKENNIWEFCADFGEKPRFYLYLCSQNETDSDNGKDISGTLRRVPDGFAKLAKPL